MSTVAETAAPPDRFAARLSGVGAVVFLANFGLLVLQLVAGKLLSPFIGSALGTWTAVIAAFLTGIALGNFLGGRMSERSPSARKLAGVLLAGVVATLWMAAFPMLLVEVVEANWYEKIGPGVRVPVLAFLLCLPVATVLSLLTPLAIRYGVPDVARTGSVAGTVFAVSSLGCLIGNYLTGFVLIPEMTINAIVYSVAGLLAVTGIGTVLVGRGTEETVAHPPERPSGEAPPTSRAAMPLAAGFAIVFLCSFAGMCLELAASRMIALLVGVSLFTWTGVIGVMLAGTCLGNWVGGKIADRAHRHGAADRPAFVLTGCLLAAAVLSVLVLIFFAVASNAALGGISLIGSVVAVTFALFFLPMAVLGTVSPQVIRLCVRDVGTAGTTAGRVYAVSTAGAIVGTFAAGYGLISSVGMKGTILVAALLPCLAVGGLVRVWKHPAMLYVMSAVCGALLGGAVLLVRDRDEVAAETNYYTIRVAGVARVKVLAEPLTDALAAAVGPVPATRVERIRQLYLDHLLHSEVNLDDPSYFKYRHEQVQLETVYAAAARKPAQRVLVIGGGGYTFPRATRTLVPTAAVDVVEIDPGVTKVAYERLGLDPALGIRSFHRDGRQFVAEQAERGVYDVVSLDAVNDLSVPGHLLTKECNDAVKRTLAPEGVYLVTVIDLVKDGRLWKAAYHTLKKSFDHVYFTLPFKDVDGHRNSVGAQRAAAKRLGVPGVEPDEITTGDLARVAAAERLDRELKSDDVVTEQDIEKGEDHRHSLKGYREAAKRLGRPIVPDAEVTLEDAVRGLDRVVIVLYASDTPLNKDALNKVVEARTKLPSDVYTLSDALTRELIGGEKELVLTDQYAPVDNLMARVFLRR